MVPLFEKPGSEGEGRKRGTLGLGAEGEEKTLAIKVEGVGKEKEEEEEKEGREEGEKKEGKIKRKISFSLLPGKGEKEGKKKEEENEKKEEKKGGMFLQVSKGKRGLKNLVPFYRHKKGGEGEKEKEKEREKDVTKLASPRGLLVAAFGGEKKEEDGREKERREEKREREAAHEVLLKSFSDAVSDLVPFDYLPIFLAEQNRTIEVTLALLWGRLPFGTLIFL